MHNCFDLTVSSFHMFPINWLLDREVWLDGGSTFFAVIFYRLRWMFLIYHINIMRHIMSDSPIISVPPHSERLHWRGCIWIVLKAFNKECGALQLEERAQRHRIIIQWHDLKTSKFWFFLLISDSLYPEFPYASVLLISFKTDWRELYF